MAYKRYRSMTNTQQKKRGNSGTGVTQHRDTHLQYRKKRMPYRKRKTWTKFVKKVQSANERQLGTKTIVFNRDQSATNTAGSQNYVMANLYGLHGSIASEIGSQDLYYAFQEAYSATAKNQKLTFKSAVLDATLTNTGNSKLEVDLYHLSYWGRPSETSFLDCQTEAIADTPLLDPNSSGFFSNLTMFSRGVTPFDMSALIKLGKFTIQKKIKYWIDVGDTATYQIRDPRTHVLSEASIIDDTNTFAHPKLTQTILCVFKPVKNVSEDVGTLTIACTRKYSINSVDSFDQQGYKNV